METQNNCCNQQKCEEEIKNKIWKWGNKCSCGCGCCNQSSCSNVGISVGVALAVVLSWTANHSIFWAAIHGLLNWFYVIYYVIVNR